MVYPFKYKFIPNVPTHDIDVEHEFIHLIDTPTTYSGLGGYYKYLQVNDSGSGIEFTPIGFLDLFDTPPTYSGYEGHILAVNSGQTGFDYVSPPPSDFLDLTDTPTTYSGYEGQYLKVKQDASGLEYTTISGLTPIDEFIELTDTPFTYSGSENKILQVKSDGSGIRFITMTTGYPKYFIPEDVYIFVGDYEQYVIHDRLYLEVAGSIELSVGAEIILMELHS